MDVDRPEFLQFQRARFTTQLPRTCLYSRSHFWISGCDNDTWRIGLTKFGSRLLGEMVDYGFELTAGMAVSSGQVVGWIEGFKGIADIASIAEGQFLGANPDLEHDPTLVNQDPYGSGWLYSVRGKPDLSCVNVEGYAKILDEIIDRLQAGAAANPELVNSLKIE
jgi:glycine cleavage system H protein